MSRLKINGPVVLRTGQTNSGRQYDYAALNVAGMTFSADINGHHDERMAHRIAREAGREIVDYRSQQTGEVIADG